MKIDVFSAAETKRPEIKVRRMAAAAFGAALTLGGLTALGQEASAISVSDQVTINPVYQQYAADVAAGNGANWKLVPDKFVNTAIIGGKGSNATLPVAYSLIDQGFGTTLKNQGLDGDCWAFATTTAIESNLKKTQGISYEFSPKQLDYLLANGTPYYTYLNGNLGLQRNLGDGGSFLLASFPLSGQYTPVGEAGFFAKMQANDASLNNYASWREFEDISQMNYNLSGAGEAYKKPMDKSLTMGETSDYLVTDYRIYAGDTDLIGEIKNNVYNYGAAYVGTVAPTVDGCWDADTETIVDRGMICGSENGHAMAIVGWDDNHAYTDPSDGSAKTGAFLLQNSWGSSTLYNDYGYDYNALVQMLISAGAITSEDDLTDAQKERLHYLTEEFNSYEYIWLGYDFDDSLVTGTTDFATVREVRANNYKKVYDSVANQAEGLGASGNTELVYTFTTGGDTESISAVSVATHGVGLGYDTKYTVYVDASGSGSNWEELGSVTMPAGEMGQIIADLDGSAVVAGTFKIKLVGTVGNEILGISDEYAPYFTTSVYTVDGEDIVVPNTAASSTAAPNTGLFTGDGSWSTFGGVMMVVGMLAMGATGYAVMKNRKHLFRKIKFEKKGF